ncbi:MAG: hypothetical protein AAB932_00570 [Patescibacteria group bacterium]
MEEQTKQAEQIKSTSLQELVEKNIKWSEVIYHQNKSIKRRLLWIVIGDYLRLAIIVVPIILGIIYLPPLISAYIGQLQALLDPSAGGDGAAASGQLNFGDLLSQFSPAQIQEVLKVLK